MVIIYFCDVASSTLAEVYDVGYSVNELWLIDLIVPKYQSLNDFEIIFSD